MELTQDLINYLNKLLPILTDEELDIESISGYFKEEGIYIRKEDGFIKGNISTDTEDLYFQYDRYSGWYKL